MWKVYLAEFIVTLIVSIVWVRSIDKMMTEHPDYKGEDFLESNAAKALMKKPKPIIKCPHCSKVGGKPQMMQWHFNNCKNLPNG